MPTADSPNAPVIAIIAGPNGAGKTTVAPALVRDLLGITPYLNADFIAEGLSGFTPEVVSFSAGVLMLDRMRELVSARASFAFETTLSAKSYAAMIRREWKPLGYRVELMFLWLPNAEAAMARVRRRVQLGGHHIPDDVVVRRHHAGLKNFFDLYRHRCDAWRFVDASGVELRTMAWSDHSGEHIALPTWSAIEASYAR